MTDAPERIWAFAADDLEDNPGCNIVAGEHVMHGAQKYIRADIVEARVTVAVARERERCANVAGDLAGKWWREYKDRNHPNCASTHREGMSDGADDVAVAIRKLGERNENGSNQETDN